MFDEVEQHIEAAREAAEPDPPFPFLPRNPVLARLGARPCDDPLPDGTTPSARRPHPFKERAALAESKAERARGAGEAPE